MEQEEKSWKGSSFGQGKNLREVKGGPFLGHRESTLKTAGMRGKPTMDSPEKPDFFLRIPLCDTRHL